MGPARRQRGAIVVPFVVAFVSVASLFGMLTESMLVLHARHKLFNGAEQALLAGANMYQSQMNLDVSTTSRQEQLTTLVKNSYCSNNYLEANNTTFDYSQIASNILTINTSKSIRLLFFRNALTLSARLAASVPAPANGITGIAPLAMLTSEYVAGRSYTIKESGGGAHAPGNYGALSLTGSGASDYEYDLTNGYSGTVSVGDALTTKPGNMSGPTDRAIASRIAAGRDVVLVILTDAFPNGRGTITVRGFAAFRVTGSSGGEITGTFINYKVSASSTTTANYGVYTKPKLLFN